MNEASATLAQMKKVNKLTRRAFHKNGPKSYKRGQGALLNALRDHDGATQRELVEILGFDRSELKGVVKKAVRNGYVTIGDHEAARTYTVSLTSDGRTIADRRAAANDRVADDVLDCLSAEELDQLNAITEKLIVSLKAKGINAKKKGYKEHHRPCHHRH